MAMTKEDMAQILQSLTVSQQAQQERQQVQQQAFQEQQQIQHQQQQATIMEAVRQMLSENKQTPPQTSHPTPDERERTRDAHKQDITITEMSYKRLKMFSGGDDQWEDWRYDFGIITRSINPPVGEALTHMIKN